MMARGWPPCCLRRDAQSVVSKTGWPQLFTVGLTTARWACSLSSPLRARDPRVRGLVERVGAHSPGDRLREISSIGGTSQGG